MFLQNVITHIEKFKVMNTLIILGRSAKSLKMRHTCNLSAKEVAGTFEALSCKFFDIQTVTNVHQYWELY